MIKKPMLAATIDDITNLRYPVYVSPKLDGIRAIIQNGVVLSRSLKPIPNQWVQKLFGRDHLNGLDGELILGDPCSPTCFRDTTSFVMSADKVADEIYFHVFDCYGPDAFNTRLDLRNFKVGSHPSIIKVPHAHVGTSQLLTHYEEQYLEQGFEGLMVRDPHGLYKFGRSTLKEGGLLKLKRFCDGEAVITGLIEQMHNANEAKVNALGHTERSSHKENMIGKNTLGALSVRDIITGVEFEIGSGFDDALRRKLWIEGDSPVGRIVKYRYSPTGSKDKPRFPTFLGFRNPMDMS